MRPTAADVLNDIWIEKFCPFEDEAEDDLIAGLAQRNSIYKSSLFFKE